MHGSSVAMNFRDNNVAVRELCISVTYLTMILMEVDYVDDQKTDGGIMLKQVFTNAKLQIGKRGKKIELTGRSPLKRQGSALDCSAIEEEEEEEE